MGPWVSKHKMLREKEPNYGRSLPISLELKYLDHKGAIRYERLYYNELQALKVFDLYPLIKRVNNAGTADLLTEGLEKDIKETKFYTNMIQYKRTLEKYLEVRD